MIISDNQTETFLIITINDTSLGYLLLIINISDTCKNQTKRLDFDNTINLSSLIVSLETVPHATVPKRSLDPKCIPIVFHSRVQTDAACETSVKDVLAPMKVIMKFAEVVVRGLDGRKFLSLYIYGSMRTHVS